VAGNVVGNFADSMGECGVHQTGLVAQGKVLEGVKEGAANFFDGGIFGEHQWQFLLELQSTRRYRRNDIPAIVYKLGQQRDVVVLQFYYESSNKNFLE